jgi:hypothetical protein
MGQSRSLTARTAAGSALLTVPLHVPGERIGRPSRHFPFAFGVFNEILSRKARLRTASSVFRSRSDCSETLSRRRHFSEKIIIRYRPRLADSFDHFSFAFSPAAADTDARAAVSRSLGVGLDSLLPFGRAPFASSFGEVRSGLSLIRSAFFR